MDEVEETKGKKIVDPVAKKKFLDELAQKNEIIRERWFKRYGWLIEEYRKIHEDMKTLCKTKDAIAVEHKVDHKLLERTIGTVPKTTNGLYGWLVTRKEFCVDQPSSYIVKYRNPLDDVAVIPGDVPTLACGKGLY